MKNTSYIKKLDSIGRFTLPSKLRKHLSLTDEDEIEVIVDNNKILLRKYENYDIFGNTSDDSSFFEYKGNKVAKKSIVELATIAGILD